MELDQKRRKTMEGGFGDESVEVWTVSTRFLRSDVVVCSHSACHSCDRCAKYPLPVVPVSCYTTYCRAFTDVSEEACCCHCTDLAFPAWLSLFQSLPLAAPSPSHSPHLLDLTSCHSHGSFAWVLFGGRATAVDCREQEMQERAARSFPEDVLQRLRYREVSGDSRDLDDWLRDVDVLLLRPRNGEMWPRYSFVGLLVSLGASLQPKHESLSSVAFLGKAEYRTSLGCNTWAFVYKVSAPE